MVETYHEFINPPTVLTQNGLNLRPKTFRIAVFSYRKEGFFEGVMKDSDLPGCDAVSLAESLPTFRKKVSL
jgi:hypothetical protein